MSTAVHPENAVWGSLFARWLRTGRIPDTGWLVGEIALPG